MESQLDHTGSDDEESQELRKSTTSASTAPFSSSNAISSTTDEDEENKIDVRLTVQQGSFLPVMCLISKSQLEASTYVVDANTGAKVIHYTGHFGKLKALKALVEEFGLDPRQQVDFYKLTVAHYAARSGELAILVYLSKVC